MSSELRQRRDMLEGQDVVAGLVTHADLGLCVDHSSGSLQVGSGTSSACISFQVALTTAMWATYLCSVPTASRRAITDSGP
jgi:hypothetical protein